MTFKYIEILFVDCFRAEFVARSRRCKMVEQFTTARLLEQDNGGGLTSILIK